MSRKHKHIVYEHELETKKIEKCNTLTIQQCGKSFNADKYPKCIVLYIRCIDGSTGVIDLSTMYELEKVYITHINKDRTDFTLKLPYGCEIGYFDYTLMRQHEKFYRY